MMEFAEYKPGLNWPKVPDFPKDAFRGTSSFYADFRPAYPNELILDLRNKISDRKNPRLLDLGCGPGRTTLPLAPYFTEIWAVDPEKEMLDEAVSRTPEKYKDRIHWIEATAESAEFSSDGFDLVTIGEAFHRMDQRVVAGKILDWLVPGGQVAVPGYRYFWACSGGWKAAVNSVLNKYRKNFNAGKIPDSRGKSMRFEDVLEAVGFAGISQKEYSEPRIWTEDEIIGCLFSVSVFSVRQLKNRAEAFEKEIRQALRDTDNDGRYEEDAVFQCLTAIKEKK